ncbi:hypothetical protein Thein_0226 [Thermodesulfatator indicus DSM 15286]|uniref:Uncharacterized protein n=1 Tax=Thermodesulfatator indicus (strain DSM 15286 / JCM 11887 / CIR29812) TaxID=667014 RepID=F8AE47_THEID|nr:hypothetical protein [Thermodesulfatator indicus]AEH44111.1 hypothetical protein Thein_0226 [Thermodesulfatator indicus DSM 15286]
MASVKISLSRQRGNFWIDNGLVVLYRLFGEGEFEHEQLLEAIVEKLVQETENEGEYVDTETGAIKKYPKKNWLYPANLFIKATPKASKTKIDGKTYFTSPPTYDLKLSFSRKKESCDLCGETAPLTKAKMWNYPFVVEPGKFANFYPGLKRELKICPTCAVAGLAAYLGWLWCAQGREALHIFCFQGDLKDLERLQREIFDHLRLGNKKRNTPLAFYGPYLHETTLGLLLRLFSYVRRNSEEAEKLSDEALELLTKLFGASENPLSRPLVLYVVTGKPGKAFDMQAFKEFSHLATLYRLYEAFVESLPSERPQEILEGVFRQFQKKEGRGYNTIWREKIAAAVLEFGDPLPFIEDFLYEGSEKRPLVFKTLEVFEVYLKEVLNMDAQLLKVIRGFGYTLGSHAQKENEMGLLYALRNAKNLDEFFRVLNDVQYRLGLTVPEDMLAVESGELIKGSPWRRVKTLLSIYAMNAFLRGQTETSKED